MNDRSASGHLVAALLLFAISVLAAMLMVLTALVVWLSSLTGSGGLLAFVSGGVVALGALAIYGFSSWEGLRRSRTQMETVYEVAYAARSGYGWLVAKVVRLLRPREGQSSE